MPRRNRNAGSQLDSPGRSTPEFRAWLHSYLSGEVGETELRRLDEAAQRAAERIRENARRRARCPGCGRPFVSSEALLELLAEIDRERPVAA